ncbi:MAG: hypothetical protein WDZ35_02245 [Crocinitomicaceae bacterium]
MKRMKQNKGLVVISLVFFGLVACEKDYCCHCIEENHADGSSIETACESVEAKNEDDAQSKCDGLSTQWGNYEKTCSLE